MLNTRSGNGVIFPLLRQLKKWGCHLTLVKSEYVITNHRYKLYYNVCLSVILRKIQWHLWWQIVHSQLLLLEAGCSQHESADGRKLTSTSMPLAQVLMHLYNMLSYTLMTLLSTATTVIQWLPPTHKQSGAWLLDSGLKCSLVVVGEVGRIFKWPPLAALKIGYKSPAAFFCQSCWATHIVGVVVVTVSYSWQELYSCHTNQSTT